jgi:hypothetical protein
VLAGVDPSSIRALVRAQLGEVTSWQEFERTPVHLDVAALVPAAERAHLDALPSSLHLRGDAVALRYEVRAGGAVVRVRLREGQARRLRDSELPVLDRPLVFAVHRRGEELQADSITALQELLDRGGPPAGGRNDLDGDPSRGRSRGKQAKGFRGRGPRGRPRR